MQRRPGITSVFFGDGAACEGIFHESLNLAVTWELPLLYVCENNEWQAFVARRETMPGNPIRLWAESHGLPAIRLDGNDVEAVRAAVRNARAVITETGKPFFLELSTYRLRGHFEPDDQAYVDAGELAAARLRCPIARLRDKLIGERVLGHGELAALEQRVLATVDAAAAFAAESPFPDVRELATDVYA